ncbi:uncharacterized protein L201_005436 [Kwoniella dendrophila CBS 6074]|uniref:Uncharacterized protein n=1 Tax=Kwoniella dendrophila CBS 6074 TaxID=1295534 RepID=A0AAX4K140_9TREE
MYSYDSHSNLKPLPDAFPPSDPFHFTSTDNLVDVNVFDPDSATTLRTSNGLVRRKSILKIPKMVDITWDDKDHQYPVRPITPNPPNSKKLQKQPKQPKGVRFTPSTEGEGQLPFNDYGLPTPEPTPEKSHNTKSKTNNNNKKLKKKPSWLHWRPNDPNHPDQDPSYHQPNNDYSFGSNNQYQLPTINDTPSPTGSDCSWHHHSSYFPEYTPIYPTHSKTSYFPTTYGLTEGEIQAQEQSLRVGRSVICHYPMLPTWSEYGGQEDKAKNGWQTSTNNSLMNNWNAFGWTGDNLPKSNELTFGKPAPVGEPLDGGAAKKKKGGNKKKKKGGEGGGGDDEEGGGEGEGGNEEGG